MLRLVICEFWKIKRKRLFQSAFLTTFIMPILYGILLTDASLDNMMSVVREVNGFLILLPLSVALAVSLFFGEHDHDTLKNLMCVPVAKGRLVMAKVFVILIFDIGYEMTGYVVGILLTAVQGSPLEGWGQELFLTLGTGVLLWAAAMPCVLLTVWFNQSYIISVIIAFAYTVLNYILHISDQVMMAPLGLNVNTFLPVPVIFRWLYQFHPLEDAGAEAIAFYNRFSPYFISTPVVFAILALEAVICTAWMIKVYQRQEV